MVTGLMWFTQFSKERPLPLRHTCEQGDHLPRYGWLMHDGKDFGSQEIVDKNFTLTTEFVKRPGGVNGGDWTARFSGKTNKVGFVWVQFHYALCLIVLGPVKKRDRGFHAAFHGFGVQSRFLNKNKKV